MHLNVVTTASTAALGVGKKMFFYALSLPFLALFTLKFPRVHISKRAAISGSVGIVILAMILASCGGGFSEPWTRRTSGDTSGLLQGASFCVLRFE